METLSRTRAHSRPSPMSKIIDQVLSARHGFIAYIPMIIISILLLIGAMLSALFINVDVLRYQCYATVFWMGAKTSTLLQAPQCQFILQFSRFHTLPLEYPPLTLAIFSAPILAPARIYPLIFALCMALISFFIYWLLLRFGPRGAAPVFAICLLVGCLGTAFARFDLVPAMFTLLCVILAERKHWTLAYISLALGVLTKLFPIVLFPLLFLAEQREQSSFYSPDVPLTIKTFPSIFKLTVRNFRTWTWKNSLLFVAVLFIITAIFWMLNSNGTFSSFSFLYLRPFEIESTGSVLVWLASFLGIPVGWVSSFGSLNTISSISIAVSQGLFILFCLGYIYILIQLWRGKMDFVQASLAAIFLLVVTNKVFSPQYFLWMAPLIAYSAANNRRLLLFWGVLSFLTTLIYPFYFGMSSMNSIPSQIPGFLPAILLRDGLFILLTLAYLLDFPTLRTRSSLPVLIRSVDR